MNLDGEGKCMYTGSKVTREDDRHAAHLCGEKICVTKTQIEFKLSRTSCEGKQEELFWFLYVSSEKRIRDNIGPLLDEVQIGLQTWQRMIPPSPLSSTPRVSWDPWSPVLQDCHLGNYRFPGNTEIV